MMLALNTRSLIVGVISLFFGFISHAQATKGDLDKHIPKRVISRIEFLIGANLVYTGGADFLKENRVGKIGFHSTLGLSHTFSSKFDLNLQVSYEAKGYKFKYLSDNPGPPPTNKFIEDVTLNYASATLLPRYSILPKRKLEIGVGPYVGYLINTKITQKSYFNDVLVRKYQSRPNNGLNFKDFDFGVSFMAGSNFNLNDRKNLTIQLLYSRGLVEFNKPEIASKINNTFSLLVGLSVDRNSYPKP